MRTAFVLLGVGVLFTGILVGSSGCELSACDDETAPAATDGGEPSAEETKSSEGCLKFESLKKFVGTSETKQVAWADGAKVRIESANGKVVVTSGGGDNVAAEFTPFSLRGHSKREQAINEIETKLEKTATGDGNGGALIKTSRKSGASGGLGADLVVKLPTGFDGTLEIEQGNGSVDVQDVVQAHTVWLHNDGAGDCDVSGGPSVTSTTVDCTFDITVADVSDDVDIHNTALGGDISVSIGSVSDGASGGKITAAQGNVSLAVPASGSFSVQATANAGGSVDVTPGSCTVEEAAANSKTLSCGSGGASYVVSAGAETSIERSVAIDVR